MDDERDVPLRSEFLDAAYQRELLEVAQRLQDQIEASSSILDDKARFLLTLDAGFLGVLLALLGVPTVLGGQLLPNAAGGILWLPLLLALGSFLLAVPALLSAYRPRPAYLDVPPAGLADLIARQLEPAAGRYNVLASTVDSALRYHAGLAAKSARFRQGAMLLQVGAFAFVALVASVALARFMLGGAP